MKTETLRAVNPFYKRVGEQYLAKEKAKENVVEEGSQFQKSNKIAVPNLLRYSFLDGEFGKKVHDEVVSKYSGFDFFDKIKYNSEKRVVEGCNPFYVVAVNEILREYGLRTANQADLEKIIKKRKGSN